MEENMSNYQTFVVNSARYKTLLTKKYKNRKKWERPDPRELYSFIPGTVLEIGVKVGQEVKEGEILMILEAMKMENKVEMPFDGVIKEINIEKGQRVPKDHLMIVVE